MHHPAVATTQWIEDESAIVKGRKRERLFVSLYDLDEAVDII